MHTDSPRTLARAAGHTTYQGAPCPQCQATTRYTSNAACQVCAHARTKAWQKDNQLRDNQRKAAAARMRRQIAAFDAALAEL